MKRFREGKMWNLDPNIGMASTYGKDKTDLIFVPYEKDTGQILLRWMVEYEYKV